MLASVPLLQFLHPHPRSSTGFVAAWLTGFVAEADSTKYIVSAAHFDARSHSFSARFFQQSLASPITLRLRQFDGAVGEDVAIFSVDDSSVTAALAPLTIAADETFSVGDEAYIIGYPHPDLLKNHYKLDSPLQLVKKGVVGAKVPPGPGRSAFLLLDAIWDQGMSGGPVIQAATAAVIGLVSARPMLDGRPLEFISCPSGDQILDALSAVS